MHLTYNYNNYCYRIFGYETLLIKKKKKNNTSIFLINYRLRIRIHFINTAKRINI